MDDKVSVYQAAQLLGCTSNWVRVLLAEERLPGAEKIGGRWLIPIEALERRRDEVSA